MDLLKTVSLILLPLSFKKGLKSLLSSVAQTRGLSINSKCIEKMYNDARLPFVFDKLQTLTLYHSILSDDEVPKLAMFFQGLQLGLKTLHIKRSTITFGETFWYPTSTSEYGLKFWESQNILFLDGLGEIEMHLLGGKSEEVLVEYILNNANNLKRIVIFSGSTLPTQIASKLIILADGSNFQSMGGMISLKLNPNLDVIKH